MKFLSFSDVYLKFIKVKVKSGLTSSHVFHPDCPVTVVVLARPGPLSSCHTLVGL